MKTNIYGQIHMLTFPLQLMTNVYVYESDDELLLIDTALKSCSNKIIEYIRSLHKPLSAIALTHAHDDHVGGLFNIHNAFPKAKIYIYESESSYYKEQCIKKNTQILEYRVLANGNIFHSLEVIETSGHTSGSISFFCPKSKSLICGDLFHSQGGLTISGDIRILFPFPDFPTQNLQTSIESAAKLKKYSIDKMFCGHGKPTPDFNNYLDHIISRANKKL